MTQVALLRAWYGWLFGRAVAEHGAWERAGYHGVRVAVLDAGGGGGGGGAEEEVWARWNPEHRRQEVWRAPVAEAVNHALAPLVEAALGEAVVPTHVQHANTSIAVCPASCCSPSMPLAPFAIARDD